MRGENRRDFRRVMTVAMALVTAALCYFHVTGRDRTEEEARREVLKMHAAATAAIEQEMHDLRARLATWKGGNDLPAPFHRVEDFGPRPTTGMRQVARPGPDGRVRPYWVFTDAADTLAEQEGETTLAPGAEYAFPLQFRGVGRARLALWAVHADEGAGPVEIAVLHRRGSFPPDPLEGGGVLRAVRREAEAGADPRDRAPDREVTLALDEALLRERHEIVLRLPPTPPRSPSSGAPPSGNPAAARSPSGSSWPTRRRRRRARRRGRPSWSGTSASTTSAGASSPSASSTRRPGGTAST